MDSKTLTRRNLLAAAAVPVLAGARLGVRTRMTMQLDCGAVGVKANPQESMAHAVKYGFQSLSADTGWLSSLSGDEVQRYLDEMNSRELVWANAGLSVEFRKSEDEFQDGLRKLPAQAAVLQRAGVTRVGTWVMPCHDSLTYMENLKQHGQRLGECAGILGNYGCRLGLEYVGPKTLWSSKRYPFVHTMKEMKELIAETGKPNVGFLLDSWHWYTAGDTVADLKTLENKDIVSVDINDAPAGIAVDRQIDSKRELPCATGVIALADFLNTLNGLDCDAPVRCEPFNAALRAMPPEQALDATAKALKKAFALIA